jgi:hypothetical protein
MEVEMTTRKSLSLLSVFLCLCGFIRAQDPRGTIGGRVVDRSDAVVVGARVQVANVQTGVKLTV